MSISRDKQAVAVHAEDDPLAEYESYLDAAPVGIDARYAWLYPGGDGEGVGLIDIEQGWNLEHPDLVSADIALASGVQRANFGHGTAVLGILVAADNDIGGVGIVPRAHVQVISEYQRGPTGTTRRVAEAILGAVRRMDRGDVLLIEAQLGSYTNPGDGRDYMVPVEIQRAEYIAIFLAVHMYGIVVVEAAGNGDVDLDQIQDAERRCPFQRSTRDSGAILVGAARADAAHERVYPSNYGSRVDCYAWGEDIVTAGGDRPSGYTMNFQYTSGAAAIVAGAAVAVQGVAQRTLGRRFTPAELRAILSSPENGTACAPGARIGVMPDLKKIIRRYLSRTAKIRPRPSSNEA